MPGLVQVRSILGSRTIFQSPARTIRRYVIWNGSISRKNRTALCSHWVFRPQWNEIPYLLWQYPKQKVCPLDHRFQRTAYLPRNASWTAIIILLVEVKPLRQNTIVVVGSKTGFLQNTNLHPKALKVTNDLSAWAFKLSQIIAIVGSNSG